MTRKKEKSEDVNFGLGKKTYAASGSFSPGLTILAGGSFVNGGEI